MMKSAKPLPFCAYFRSARRDNGVCRLGPASLIDLSVAFRAIRFCFLWLIGAILLAGAAAAGADGQFTLAAIDKSVSRLGEPTHRFDIPPQPLGAALEKFGRLADVQLLYKTQLVHDLHSPGVSGVYAAAEALQRLLDGTGLIASYSDPKAFTLIAVVRPEAGLTGGASADSQLSLAPLRVLAAPYDTFAYDTYSRLVQLKVRQALTSGSAANLTGRTVRILVWVDADGVIQKPRLYTSSGDQTIDSVIVNRLTGTSVDNRPPAGLPQPLHIRISNKL
jgi:hypothetical protein